MADVTLHVAEAGIRYPQRKDLLIIHLDEGCTVSGVFTQNRFCAASVLLCKSHLKQAKPIRLSIINIDNANARLGKIGMVHARLVSKKLAGRLNCVLKQTLAFSTGVILEITLSKNHGWDKSNTSGKLGGSCSEHYDR